MVEYAEIRTNSDALEFRDKDQTTYRDLDSLVKGENRAFTVGARAYLASDQDNIAAGGAGSYKINLGNETYDIASNFDTGNNCFIVPTTGYYVVIGTVRFENTDVTSGKIYQAKIYVDPLGVGSPAQKVEGIQQVASATAALVCTVGDIIYLTETDKVYLYCYTDDTDVDIDGGATSTFMSINLLGV